jgi:hypothetical protein
LNWNHFTWKKELKKVNVRSHSQNTFELIHQRKIALGLLEKVLVILQNRCQSVFHLQYTEMIHSKVHFTFQQTDFRTVIEVNPPTVRKWSNYNGETKSRKIEREIEVESGYGTAVSVWLFRNIMHLIITWRIETVSISLGWRRVTENTDLWAIDQFLQRSRITRRLWMSPQVFLSQFTEIFRFWTI